MKYFQMTLGVALVAGLGMSSMATQAAEDSEYYQRLSERLVTCRAMDSSVERLDCYDRVASDLDTASDEDLARGRDSQGAAQLRAEENRERASSRQEEAQQRALEAREEAERRRSEASSNDFGREHRRSVEDEDGRRYVEIVEAWQNPRGAWRFSLADGSEWHQTQTDRFHYDENNTYYIERGALNSFRLGWDGSNRNIRVRRVD